jgi:hypothetical protein
VGFYGKKDEEEKAVTEEKAAESHYPETIWHPAGKDTFYCEMPTGIVLRYKNYPCFVPNVIVVNRKGVVEFQQGSR